MASSTPPTVSKLRIYVGNLSTRTKQKDLEELFSKIGKLREVSLKGHFGFVEYDDDRDAEEAVRKLDDIELDGSRIKTEFARDKSDRAPRPGTGKCFKCGVEGHWARECGKEKRGSSPPRRSPPYRSRSPPPRRYGYDSYDRYDPYYRDRGPPPAWDEYYDDPYRRDPYRDPYRDSYRPPYDYRDRDYYRDDYRGPPPRDYRGPPPRSRYSPPRREGPPPARSARPYDEIKSRESGVGVGLGGYPASESATSLDSRAPLSSSNAAFDRMQSYTYDGNSSSGEPLDRALDPPNGNSFGT